MPPARAAVVRRGQRRRPTNEAAAPTVAGSPRGPSVGGDDDEASDEGPIEGEALLLSSRPPPLLGFLLSSEPRRRQLARHLRRLRQPRLRRLPSAAVTAGTLMILMCFRIGLLSRPWELMLLNRSRRYDREPGGRQRRDHNKHDDLYRPDPILALPHLEGAFADVAAGWCSSSQDPPESSAVSAAVVTPAARVLLLTKRRPRIYFRHPHDDPASLMSDELLNIVQAGLEASPCFRLYNFTVVPDLVLDDPSFEMSRDLIVSPAPQASAAPPRHAPAPAVWVVDMRRYDRVRRPYNPAGRGGGSGGNYTILDGLVVLVNNTLNRLRQHQQQHQQQHPSPPVYRKLVVVLMDYRDYIPELDLCRALPEVRQLVRLLGRDHVRYVMQQTVRGRQWNPTSNFVELGDVYDPRNTSECWGGRSLLHAPYTVRDDVAEAVRNIAAARTKQKKNTKEQQPPPSPRSAQGLPEDPHTPPPPAHPRPLLPPIDDPEFFGPDDRPVDVAHMWEHDDRCAYLPASRVPMPCELRNQVTRALNEHFRPPRYTVRTKIADSLGVRTTVQDGYVSLLASSKVVVVSQRDMWEDSYRLMEALVGGAMVMTDPMLTLPTGLVDGESIVIYESLQDLPRLVEHYLNNDAERIEIARRGHRVALTMHRPHHWMERLFFGKVMTS